MHYVFTHKLRHLNTHELKTNQAYLPQTTKLSKHTHTKAHSLFVLTLTPTHTQLYLNKRNIQTLFRKEIQQHYTAL